MIIHWEGEKNFSIKTKTLTAKIGQKIQLGELEITGPGEYEVGGVQIETIDDIIEVYAEGICIGHIQKGRVLSDSDLEKLNGIDILLIGVGGGEFSETKTALQVIAQIEPTIVIPMYSQNPPASGAGLAEFAKEEGVATEGREELKISKAELPSEERQVVVLNARR